MESQQTVEQTLVIALPRVMAGGVGVMTLT
jgi:hypothetical protein